MVKTGLAIIDRCAKTIISIRGNAATIGAARADFVRRSHPRIERRQAGNATGRSRRPAAFPHGE
ncbi:hypothetical protein B0E47_01140 [Rhodanobacter sp. B05]|nr:hypothetical protein B0E47_01140 [Rhodanobacter sp. B05]